jgi:hypothetical protein
MTTRATGVVLALLLLAACNRSSEPAIPGLDPSEEVELVEVEPDPSDDSFVWSHALQVADLPQVNVGHPTSEFLEDAARVDDNPEDYLCNSGGGCDIEDPEGPSIGGLNFGGPDILAWSWVFLPDDAIAVRFTDQDGRTTWQRPLDRIVIFPDTVEGGIDDVACACQLDAIDEGGAVIVSVSVETGSYING